MKKTIIIVSLIFGMASLMSCRSQKQACAAYSQVERSVDADENI